MINKLHGSFVSERLKAARAAAGGSIAWGKVAEIIQHAYEEEAKAFTAFIAPPKPRRAPSAPRKRDEFIDALVSCCGGDPLQLTRGAIQAAAVAMAEIKQVSPDVTLLEVRARVARYKEKHRDWPLTPMAISKHWHDLGSSIGRTYSAANDPDICPDNWRERALKALGDVELPETWEEIGRQNRKTILARTS